MISTGKKWSFRLPSSGLYVILLYETTIDSHFCILSDNDPAVAGLCGRFGWSHFSGEGDQHGDGQTFGLLFSALSGVAVWIGGKLSRHLLATPFAARRFETSISTFIISTLSYSVEQSHYFLLLLINNFNLYGIKAFSLPFTTVFR